MLKSKWPNLGLDVNSITLNMWNLEFCFIFATFNIKSNASYKYQVTI